MALFAQSAQSSSRGSTNGHKHSIEIKAGRMYLVSSEQEAAKKKIVHPDLRQGLIYLYSDDDGLTHFCWKERPSGNVEEDVIVFPDECELKRVDQCKDGRVVLLQWKLATRKMFFWLQEPLTDKDDENLRRVNELLNKAANSGEKRDSELQSMLGNMSQRQLMRLLGTVGQLNATLGSTSRTSGESDSSANTSASDAVGDVSATDASTKQVTASSVQETPKDSCEDGKKEKSAEPKVSDSQDEDEDEEETTMNE